MQWLLNMVSVSLLSELNFCKSLHRGFFFFLWRGGFFILQYILKGVGGAYPKIKNDNANHSTFWEYLRLLVSDSKDPGTETFLEALFVVAKD